MADGINNIDAYLVYFYFINHCDKLRAERWSMYFMRIMLLTMKHHSEHGYNYLCTVFRFRGGTHNLNGAETQLRWQLPEGWLGSWECVVQVVKAYEYYITDEPHGAGMTKIHDLVPGQVWRIIADPDLPELNPM